MGNVNTSSLVEKIDEPRARAAFSAIARSADPGTTFTAEALAASLEGVHAIVPARLFTLLSPTGAPVTWDMFKAGWAAVTVKHSKWHRTVYALLDLEGGGHVTLTSLGAWLSLADPSMDVEAVWHTCRRSNPAYATMDEISDWRQGQGKAEFARVSAALQSFFTIATAAVCGTPETPSSARGHKHAASERAGGGHGRHRRSDVAGPASDSSKPDAEAPPTTPVGATDMFEMSPFGELAAQEQKQQQQQAGQHAVALTSSATVPKLVLKAAPLQQVPSLPASPAAAVPAAVAATAAEESGSKARSNTGPRFGIFGRRKDKGDKGDKDAKDEKTTPRKGKGDKDDDDDLSSSASHSQSGAQQQQQQQAPASAVGEGHARRSSVSSSTDASAFPDFSDSDDEKEQGRARTISVVIRNKPIGEGSEDSGPIAPLKPLALAPPPARSRAMTGGRPSIGGPADVPKKLGAEGFAATFGTDEASSSSQATAKEAQEDLFGASSAPFGATDDAFGSSEKPAKIQETPFDDSKDDLFAPATPAKKAPEAATGSPFGSAQDDMFGSSPATPERPKPAENPFKPKAAEDMFASAPAFDTPAPAAEKTAEGSVEKKASAPASADMFESSPFDEPAPEPAAKPNPFKQSTGSAPAPSRPQPPLPPAGKTPKKKNPFAPEPAKEQPKPADAGDMFGGKDDPFAQEPAKEQAKPEAKKFAQEPTKPKPAAAAAAAVDDPFGQGGNMFGSLAAPAATSTPVTSAIEASVLRDAETGLREAMAKMECGKFSEGLLDVRRAVSALTSQPSLRDRHRARVRRCVAYDVALRCLAEADRADPTRAAMLSSIAAGLPLRAAHRCACLRLSVSYSIRAGLYPGAAVSATLLARADSDLGRVADACTGIIASGAAPPTMFECATCRAPGDHPLVPASARCGHALRVCCKELRLVDTATPVTTCAYCGCVFGGAAAAAAQCHMCGVGPLQQHKAVPN